MFRYMNYGPYICIGVVLAILFVLWAFWGGKPYDFVGLAPLSPDTCGSYTGSFYNWGNITPATGYDPIEGHNCVPPDTACSQDNINILNQSSQHQIVVDNTPLIPPQFSLNSHMTHSSPGNLDGVKTNTIVEGLDLGLNSFNDPTESLLPNESTGQTICPQEEIDASVNFKSSFATVEIPLILDYNPRTRNPGRISGERNLNVSLTGSSNNNNNKDVLNNSKHSEITLSSLPMFLPQPRNPITARPPQRGRFISRGERMCCQTMERIYGVTFKSIWPDWLRNPETGETLELDCYNDDLKIAVEYNGEQHYKWPNFTNQTYQQFINQTRRDTLKIDLCDKNGVYLIVVPYNVAYENIPSYIMSHLPETIQKRLQEEKTLSDLNL